MKLATNSHHVSGNNRKVFKVWPPQTPTPRQSRSASSPKFRAKASIFCAINNQKMTPKLLRILYLLSIFHELWATIRYKGDLHIYPFSVNAALCFLPAFAIRD